jgi:hypothetical protein
MNKKRILIGIGLGLGLVVLSLGLVAAVWMGPRNVLGMLRYDTRRQGVLRVGERAPDVELVVPQEPASSAPRVHLRDRLTAGRPLVLVFGSFT